MRNTPVVLFCLLQGFIPLVVPDMLKGAVFVSCLICSMLLEINFNYEMSANCFLNITHAVPLPLMTSVLVIFSTSRRVVGCSPMPIALRSTRWTRLASQT